MQSRSIKQMLLGLTWMILGLIAYITIPNINHYSVAAMILWGLGNAFVGYSRNA